MTDPKPTTNEEIALLRDWRRASTGMPEGWIDPNGVELGWVENLPDFEHEWACVGPLLEELCISADEVRIMHTTPEECRKIEANSPEEPDFVMPVWLVEAHLHEEGEGDTLTQAISHAWLAWKKEGA